MLPKKMILFLLVLLLSSIFSNCKKVFDTNFNEVNCNNLQQGLIKSNSKTVCTEITKLSSDLSPDTSSSDKFGHGDNLNLLVDRINESCDNTRAELLCYACIETNPPQSEIKLSTDSSGVEISRILDMRTPPDDFLTCVRLH